MPRVMLGNVSATNKSLPAACKTDRLRLSRAAAAAFYVVGHTVLNIHSACSFIHYYIVL